MKDEGYLNENYLLEISGEWGRGNVDQTAVLSLVLDQAWQQCFVSSLNQRVPLLRKVITPSKNCKLQFLSLQAESNILKNLHLQVVAH